MAVFRADRDGADGQRDEAEEGSGEDDERCKARARRHHGCGEIGARPRGRPAQAAQPEHNRQDGEAGHGASSAQDDAGPQELEPLAPQCAYHCAPPYVPAAPVVPAELAGPTVDSVNEKNVSSRLLRSTWSSVMTAPAFRARWLSAPAKLAGASTRRWPSRNSLSNCCSRATAAMIRSSSGDAAPMMSAVCRPFSNASIRAWYATFPWFSRMIQSAICSTSASR